MLLLLRPTSILLRPTCCLTANVTITRAFHNYPSLRQTEQPKIQSNTTKSHTLKEPEIKILKSGSSKQPNPTVTKIIDKLPKSLQKYGHRLVNSPVSHITSFLILHELSAVIPFLGLWFIFHEFHFLPADIPSWVIIKGTKFAEAVLGDTINDFSLADRTKLIIEGATAYGIVKALFPLRVIGSVFLTPWFARVLVEPVFNLFRRVLGINKKS